MRLKELRIEKGLTQQKIVDYLECSYNKYHSWETGRTQPSIEDLITLAEFFQVGIDYLVGHSEADNVVYAATQELPADDRELLDEFHQLTPAAKSQLKGYLQGLLAAPGITTARKA